MGVAPNRYNKFFLYLLTFSALMEFILLRTLQRVITPLIYVGRVFQYTALFVGFITLFLLGRESNHRLEQYMNLGLIVVFLLSIFYSSIWGAPPPPFSVVYYLYLPVYALTLFLYSYRQIPRILMLSLLLNLLSLSVFCYYHLVSTLLSHWNTPLPFSIHLVELSIYLSLSSIILGSIYGFISAKLKSSKFILFLLASSVVIGPLIALGIFSHKLLNYFSLYILEVFGLPLSLSLVVPFFAVLLLALTSILANVGRVENTFSCGFSLVILGGYHLSIVYYPLLWLTGFSTLLRLKDT